MNSESNSVLHKLGPVRFQYHRKKILANFSEDMLLILGVVKHH